jgi:hypothetical protein
MSIAQQQFEKLKRTHPGRIISNLVGRVCMGSRAEFLPFPLAGHTQRQQFVSTCLRHIPMQSPIVFWTDAALRLSNGAEPQASRVQTGPPNTEPQLRWFFLACLDVVSE